MYSCRGLRVLLLLPALVVVVGLSGCGAPLAVDQTAVTPVSELPGDESLRLMLDEVLDFTLAEQRLAIDQHAAWQILHGALTYKRQFPVDVDGQPVSAVDHILAGGAMRGWDVELVAGDEGRLPGIRLLLDQGSKAGQGHWDQWFAILAQCHLPADGTIRVADQALTMQQIVDQVLQDVPRNLDREFSWTLIGLTEYLPTDYQWTAGDGRSWSLDNLLESELEHDLNASACGGTHRLIGMTMALNRHVVQQRPVTGTWNDAAERINWAIQRVHELQNADGSFSTNYLLRGGASPDLSINLGTTGHTLEFLSLAMNDDQLREPWVTRAVVRLCEIFRLTRGVPLECGALYHATHGLDLYRARRFGPRD